MKGSIAILFTVLIMSILLAIGFAISSLMIKETKMSRSISDSIIAYYTAESIIEWQLYESRWGIVDAPVLGVEATYEISSGPEWIKVIASYKNAKRSIEVTWPEPEE